MISLVLLLTLLSQPAVPPVPPIAIDAFPAPARAAMTRVHVDAASRPDDPAAVGAFARMLQAWEQWDAAHQAYVRLQHLEPKAFEWRYLDAIVLQRLALHLQAAAALRAALVIAPAYLPARARLAEALFEAGHREESAALYAALRQEPAAEPVAELGLGRIAAANGRHDAAVTHFERAITLFPEFGPAHYALALSYREIGRLDDARRAMTRHQQLGPRWPAIDDGLAERVAALRDDARSQVRRGMRLAEGGDLAGAIAAHEAALAVEPSLADAHANLISLYGRAGQWTKAEEQYRAVVALGVNLADAHYDYGVLLGMQAKWELAAAAYRQSVAANPAHAQAHNNLGQVLERQRRMEEAAAEYRRAVESQPTFRLARFNLGRILIALDRPDDAAAELEKIVEPRDAEAPRYLFGLAAARLAAGRRGEGMRWANEARALAIAFGQHDLAAAIDRDLARLR